MHFDFLYNFVSPCPSGRWLSSAFFLYWNIILISYHTYLMVHPAVTGNNVVMEHISLLFSERLESGRLPVSLGEVVHQRRRRRPRKTPTSLKDHRVLSSCSCLYLLCSFLYISPLASYGAFSFTFQREESKLIKKLIPSSIEWVHLVHIYRYTEFNWSNFAYKWQTIST